MKVLRFYNHDHGRLIQQSYLVPDEDDIEEPRPIAKISMNIDPMRDSKHSIFKADFNDVPFLVRVSEIRHYLRVIDAMFNDKP